jgi:hypothetical protein
MTDGTINPLQQLPQSSSPLPKISRFQFVRLSTKQILQNFFSYLCHSRLSFKCKRFSRKYISTPSAKGMIDGYILRDPIFLHLPKSTKS